MFKNRWDRRIPPNGGFCPIIIMAGKEKMFFVLIGVM